MDDSILPWAKFHDGHGKNYTFIENVGINVSKL